MLGGPNIFVHVTDKHMKIVRAEDFTSEELKNGKYLIGRLRLVSVEIEHKHQCGLFDTAKIY